MLGNHPQDLRDAQTGFDPDAGRRAQVVADRLRALGTPLFEYAATTIEGLLSTITSEREASEARLEKIRGQCEFARDNLSDDDRAEIALGCLSTILTIATED